MKMASSMRNGIVMISLGAGMALCAHAAEQAKLIASPSELQWADTGPQFPETQLVILDGDPGKSGPVTLRFRCPPDHKILPHTHPGPERVTVLTGTMNVGLGPKYEADKLRAVETGGYFVVPTRAAHYAECKGDTIVEIHTTGPLGTTYVNPADDPSRKK